MGRPEDDILSYWRIIINVRTPEIGPITIKLRKVSLVIFCEFG